MKKSKEAFYMDGISWCVHGINHWMRVFSSISQHCLCVILQFIACVWHSCVTLHISIDSSTDSQANIYTCTSTISCHAYFLSFSSSLSHTQTRTHTHPWEAYSAAHPLRARSTECLWKNVQSPEPRSSLMQFAPRGNTGVALQYCCVSFRIVYHSAESDFTEC